MVVRPARRGQAASRASVGAARRSSRTPPRVAALVLAIPLVSAACGEPVRVEETWLSHGQPARAEIWMSDAAAAGEALAAIHESIDATLTLLDPEHTGGALAEMNRAAENDYYTVRNADLSRALHLALDYAQFTKGAFDPTVAPLEKLYARSSGRIPTDAEVEVVMARVGWDRIAVAPEAHAFRFLQPGMELDLGVVASGFALDVAARVFAQPGSRGGLLSLGPGMLVWEPPPGQAEWVVTLDDPRRPGRPLLDMTVANRGLGTRGHVVDDNRNATLVLDPRSGHPAASDVLAAVAAADSVADATALAEALLVIGSREAGDLLRQMIRAEAVLLVAGNGQPALLASASLQGKLQPSPELEAEIGGRIRYILPPTTIAVEIPKPR